MLEYLSISFFFLLGFDCWVFFFFFKINLFIWVGRGKGRGTENFKPTPDVGFDPMTLKSCPEPKSRVGHPIAEPPRLLGFFVCLFMTYVLSVPRGFPRVVLSASSLLHWPPPGEQNTPAHQTTPLHVALGKQDKFLPLSGLYAEHQPLMISFSQFI